jgi:hypothetical protein
MKSSQNLHNYDWKGSGCQPIDSPSSAIVVLTEACPVPPKGDRRGPGLPAGPEPSVRQGRREGAQQHAGKLFDKLRAVSSVERPRPRAASLLTDSGLRPEGSGWIRALIEIPSPGRRNR